MAVLLHSTSWKSSRIRSYETMINRIRATRTKSGLSVTATLDQHEYQFNVSKSEFTVINIKRHRTRLHWNYTIGRM